MQRTFLRAKLHRVTTTASEVDYEGSCEIDGVLLDAAGIGSFEQIQIYNINNGNRFITYAIRGKDNSGVISLMWVIYSSLLLMPLMMKKNLKIMHQDCAMWMKITS